MIAYTTIYGLLSVSAFAQTRTRAGGRLVGASLFVILLAFVGGRLETGCDYSQYLFHFERLLRASQYANSLDAARLSFFSSEVGFYALNWITLRLGLDFIWLNLFAATIFLLCMFVFVRRFENPALILMCYFPVLMVQLGMGNLRQCLAVGVMFLALNAFCDRRGIWVAAWVLLAFTFHNSAVIFLPLAAFADRRVTVERVVAVAMLSAPIVVFLISGRFETYSDRYIDHRFGEKESIGGIIRLGILIAGSVIFFLFRQRFRAFMPREHRLILIYSAISLALVLVLPISSTIVHRLGYYLMPIQILPIALAPGLLTPASQGRVSMVLPIGFFLAYLVGWLMLSAHAQECWLPYRSAIFSGV